MLSVVLEIEKILLSVIVYRIPGPFGTFIDGFILLINKLPTQHRIFIVCDFNLDEILPDNIAKVDPLIQNFNMSQRLQYSTHLHGGALNLVFDTSNSNAFSFLPSPYSDHFVLFSKSDHYIYIEFSFQQFSFQSSLQNLQIPALISSFLSLMKELVKIFGESNHQSKGIISFLF